MNLLFLDDAVERHEKARKAFIGISITHVRTAWEAIEALKRERFDIVSLDHDLGGRVMVMSDEEAGPDGCGLDVAKFIVSMRSEDRPARVYIHSMNPVGGENMARVLASVGINAKRYIV